MSKDSLQRITRVCEILHDAARKTRVLSHLGWPGQVREQFFIKGCKELPSVDYPEYDAAPVLEQIGFARDLIQGSSIDIWLERQADALYNSAQMLVHTGSREFFDYSRRLYGAPDDLLLDGQTTSLKLAVEFNKTMVSLKDFDQKFLPKQSVSREQMAASI